MDGTLNTRCLSNWVLGLLLVGGTYRAGVTAPPGDTGESPATVPASTTEPSAPATRPATVTVDFQQIIGKSQLKLGVTQTHIGLDSPKAKPQAVERAEAELKTAIAIQNTHILGWGVGSPEPSPGVFDWHPLDQRMQMMRKLDAPIVITLCSAPGWMKPGGKDFGLGDRVSREHFQDFADLCVAVARHFPEVKSFQVWNEFKGFWNRADNRWDVEAYTEMYNKVYDALKAYDPTLKIGGFYLVVSGTGSGALGKTGTATGNPMVPEDLAALQYWNDHKHGADFVCVDRGLKSYHDKNTYTVADAMTLTHWFADITRQVRRTTNLPVWWSEYYGVGKISDVRAQAAEYASIDRNLVLGGASVALLWNPVQGEVQHWLVTDVRDPDGGQVTPHFEEFKAFHDDFPDGTTLVASSSDNPLIETLASTSRIMLINCWGGPATIRVNGHEFSLQGYEVRVLDRSQL